MKVLPFLIALLWLIVIWMIAWVCGFTGFVITWACALSFVGFGFYYAAHKIDCA